jgi:uncharacterized membrane protein YhaH (DUF805 family)
MPTDLGIGFLVVLAVYVTAQVLLVYFENSGKTITRRAYTCWQLGLGALVALGIFAPTGFGGLVENPFAIAALTFAFGIATLIASLVFMRQIVRRARGAGLGKTIAYLSLIPVVSLVTIIVLQFMPPKPALVPARVRHNGANRRGRQRQR